MGFWIKVIIAWLLNTFRITDLSLRGLNQKYENQYIRIVNYHDTKKENIHTFERHLRWYRKHFDNVDYRSFKNFLESGKLRAERPGIMLTFDDGLKGNYEVAKRLLKEYGFTGYFMCSSELIGTGGYMTETELKELINDGNVVGSHTATHHRMRETDEIKVLDYEIREAKLRLQDKLEIDNVEIFCWCGGEEKHYTKAAFDKIIESGYKYGFMTNSAPVFWGEDHYMIQRINVEDSWPVFLMKFQISGIMDKRMEKKRIRIANRMIQREE